MPVEAGDTDMERAVEVGRGLRTDPGRGQRTDPDRGRTLFACFAELFLELAASQGVNTIKNYRGVIRRELLPVFGHVPLDTLTPQLVGAWVAQLRRRQLAPATIRTYKAILSAVMQQAVTLNYGVLSNPCDVVKTPRTPPQRIRAISQQNVADIMHALPGPIARLLVEVDLQTGCRWGELTELRGRDVLPDPDRADRVYLSIERSVADVGAADNPRQDGNRFFIQDMTKGGHDRRIGLSVNMTDKILTYLDQARIGPDGLLFPLSRLKNEYAHAAPAPSWAPLPIPDDLGQTAPNTRGRTYRHGTMSAYTAGACKCGWCRRAFAQYRAHRRQQGADLHPTTGISTNGRNTTDHCPSDWFRRRIWKPALTAADIRRRVVFYDLRHTHATWLAHSHKVDIDTLRRRMGHRRLETTQRYIHAADILDTTAADVMDDLMTTPTVRRDGRQ